MFKKQITHFILYHLRGDSNNKFSIYVTSEVSTTRTEAFKKTLNEECIKSHLANYGVEPIGLSIESIQMISFQISIFGKRII